MIPYEGMRVYGPYTRIDKRKHVIIWDGKKTKTVSYPKYLLECHIGRYLEDWETADHKDEDYTNDDINNLQVLSRKDNCIKSNKVPGQWFHCAWCESPMFLEGKKLSDRKQRKKQGKAGPFCSKTCTGNYATSVQYKCW